MNIKVSDVRKAVKTHLHLTRPIIKKLGSGESNTNFLVDDKYIVRVNADLKEKHKISKEYRVLKYLQPYNISPTPYTKDTTKRIIPQDYLIIEYIPGQDLKRMRLSSSMIRDIARVTATLHSIPIGKNIPFFRMTYSDVKKSIVRYIRLAKKYGGAKDSVFLLECLPRLIISGPDNVVSITHGDICEQNMIYDTNNELKFIDFESCGVSDPAYDIADVFTGFGKRLYKNHQEIFYDEYLKHRSDTTLKKRVEAFIPLKMFETFCWSVMHVYEIKKGIVSKDIQDKEPIKHHTDYAYHCLNECRKLGLVSNKKVSLFEGLL
ncbi:MAG: aminoglycoside phosphotransferase family protein [Candidatus Woesearchaeota archaeon]